MLRRLFGPKGDEVTGEWGRLHNEELNDLYSLLNIIRAGNEGADYIACMGERRAAYRVLVGKPEEWRTLGRPKHRWEDIIKIDLQDVGWGHELDLAQNGDGWRALMKSVMNLRFP